MNEDVLIDNNGLGDTRLAAESSGGIFRIYLDREGQSTVFDDHPMDAVEIPSYKVNFINELINRLNSEINLSLEVTDDPESADIRILQHNEALPWHDYAGFTTTSWVGSSRFMRMSSEIALVRQEGESQNEAPDSNFWAHVIVHELGHALGLEHPFDSDDGDSFGDVDNPTTDETVMAYGDSERNRDGIYADWFWPVDLAALRTIYSTVTPASSNPNNSSNPNSPPSDSNASSFNIESSFGRPSEGEAVTWTITSDNGNAGSVVYWQISGDNITTSDLAGGALSGSLSLDSDGSAVLSDQIREDGLTEGHETLSMAIFADPARSIELDRAPSLWIQDTSTGSGLATDMEDDRNNTSNSSSIHRFYNTNSGVHFYTPSDEEKNTVIANPGWGYNYEGVAYQAPSDGGTELYRFYHASKGYHFLTTSEAEANSVIEQSIGSGFDLLTGQGVAPNSSGWGYQYEGRTFQVSTEESEATPTEVYRFFHPDKGVHFYSASLDEVRTVITESCGAEYANDLEAAKNAPLLANGWGYQLESTAWYVL